MYSTAVKYFDIEPVLLVFAAQQIRKQITKEADTAIKPQNGLLVPITAKSRLKVESPERPDIGRMTI